MMNTGFSDDLELVIEDVDSEEEAEMSAKRERERIHATMKLIKQSIVDYLKYIGEDREFFQDGISDISDSFARWSYLHCMVTECQNNWLRVRNIFVGSSAAQDLCKRPLTVIDNHAPFKMAAGFIACRPPTNNIVTCQIDAVALGIAMKSVIRNVHVRIFSKPLKAKKSWSGGVNTRSNWFGMHCRHRATRRIWKYCSSD